MTCVRITAIAALCALSLAGCAGGGEETPATASSSVLGVVWKEGGASFVARLDARSLEPLPGPRARLWVHGGPWAFSPDGSLVAFGGSRAIRIIDVKRMRVVGDVPTDVEFVGVVAWPEPRRLLLVTGMNWEEGVDALVVDPLARRIHSRRPLGGSLQDFTRTDDGLVLLLGPRSGIGPARLAVFSVRGGIRTVRLERVPAGFRTEQLERGFSVDYFRTPGVAVSRPAKRAFVVTGENVVTEVDLRTLRVSYHELGSSVSLLGRLRDWLEPAAKAKGASDGSVRRALWLDNGFLAVSGWDDNAFFDSEGNQQQMTTAAGLALVDTRTWSTQMVEPDATGATLATSLLFAYGSRWSSQDGRFEGSGLTAFDLAGERRFHLFGDEPVGSVEVAGRYAYVVSDSSSSCGPGQVIHLSTGNAVRELAPDVACNRPSLLVPEP